FAYELAAGETYLLTNEHVAVWPEVTDSNRHVDGVPEGCRRFEQRLRIVQDEHDDYEAGQIPLSRVASDPQLDAAVLKAGRARARPASCSWSACTTPATRGTARSTWLSASTSCAS